MERVGDILPFSWEQAGEYTLLVAIVLAASHFASPWIRISLINYTAQAASFGGGLAVTYVFLQLIPEIEEAHEYLGDQAHFIIHFSFLTFFALESHLRGCMTD